MSELNGVDSLSANEENDNSYASDSEISSESVSETKEDCQLTDYLNEKPPDLCIPDEVPASIKFHPVENLLCIGCYSGNNFMVSYEVDKCEIIHKLPGHDASSRSLKFSEDGSKLFSVSADHSIHTTDVERCHIIKKWKNAHSDSLTSIIIADENIFGTGDEGGTVKVWDCRQKNALFSAKKVDEYISSLIVSPDHKLLISTSSDGFLTTFDLRMQKFLHQNNQKKELITSMSLRDGSRLVCGTSSTSFLFFAWENLPSSCGAFVVNMKKWKYMPSASKISEYFIACGSEVGFVRAVRIFPHENVGIIGHLDSSGSCDILDTSYDSTFLAGSDFHGPVRFWNVSYLQQEEYQSYQRPKLCREEKHLPSSSYSNPGEFFVGLQ